MKLNALFIILILSSLHPLLSRNIIHSDNKLFELRESSLYELNIKPEIKFFSVDKNNICFLRNKNSRSQKITIGLYDISEKKILLENDLSYDWKSNNIIKFSYQDSSAYIFMKDNKNIKTAVKINLNDFSFSSYKNIEDFSVISGIPAVIERKNNAYLLKFGNTEIPLVYKDAPQFINTIDERIIIISDGKIYDFIDINQKKSLYSHNTRENFEDYNYNFEISLIDESIPENNNDEKITLYKIYIDGSEIGRTESGYAGIEKKYRDNLSVDAYHTVKAELWELNSGKNKYERANNIRQLSTMKIFVPKGRKIIIKVKFDGTSYKTSID